MKKTKILGLALAGLLSLNGVAVLADTNRTFTGFILKANQANNYTAPRLKETGNDYSYIKCTGLTSTTKATFWIANESQKMISETVDLPVVSDFYIVNYNTDLKEGTKVCLGMENYYSTSSTATASGVVDYE